MCDLYKLTSGMWCMRYALQPFGVTTQSSATLCPSGLICVYVMVEATLRSVDLQFIHSSLGFTGAFC